MSGNLNLKQLFDFFLQANIDKIWIKLMEMKIFFMIFIDEDQQTRKCFTSEEIDIEFE